MIGGIIVRGRAGENPRNGRGIARETPDRFRIHLARICPKKRVDLVSCSESWRYFLNISLDGGGEIKGDSWGRAGGCGKI